MTTDSDSLSLVALTCAQLSMFQLHLPRLERSTGNQQDRQGSDLRAKALKKRVAHQEGEGPSPKGLKNHVAHDAIWVRTQCASPQSAKRKQKGEATQEQQLQ